MASWFWFSSAFWFWKSDSCSTTCDKLAYIFDPIIVSLKASCSNGPTPVSCFLVVLYFTNIGILHFLLRSSGSPCCADALNLNLHFTKKKKEEIITAVEAIASFSTALNEVITEIITNWLRGWTKVFHERNGIIETKLELPPYQDRESVCLSSESFNMVYRWSIFRRGKRHAAWRVSLVVNTATDVLCWANPPSTVTQYDGYKK